MQTGAARSAIGLAEPSNDVVMREGAAAGGTAILWGQAARVVLVLAPIAQRVGYCRGRKPVRIPHMPPEPETMNP